MNWWCHCWHVCYSLQKLKTSKGLDELFSSPEHKLRYYLWNVRASLHCIDSNGQHQWFNRNFMKLQEYFLKRRNCWINVLFLFFFVQKKYFRIFIKLGLNHWCHMDYFNGILTIFVGLEHVSCIQKSLGFHQKYLNLCSEDELMSYMFRMTIVMGWTIPLIFSKFLSNIVWIGHHFTGFSPCPWCTLYPVSLL